MSAADLQSSRAGILLSALEPFPHVSVPRFALRRVLRAAFPWVLLLSITAVARADYTPEEVMRKGGEAHAQLSRFSMQVWTRAFQWDEAALPSSETSVSKIVNEGPGVTALVGVNRHSYTLRDSTDKRMHPGRLYRTAYRIAPGPRFLVGEWSEEKNRIIDRPVTAETYRKDLPARLSFALAGIHPFRSELFGRDRRYAPSIADPNDHNRIAGRENIAGHDCIRMDTPHSTIWFDAKTFLVRRVLWQRISPKSNRIVDLYCDIRILPADEVANLNPPLDESFEDTAMQWVPFIPIEQLQENLRITGRAAGLLIARPEDQPQAQPALPPLSPEQRAAIVTIEGNELSGLGFYVRYAKEDYLVTDVRFLTKNRWVKIRDWQGNKITFTDAVHAPDTRVVLLKATSVPGRLAPSTPSPRRRQALLLMLCAFNKPQGHMQAAFCVSRPTPAGAYAVEHALADYISGGPILNVDDGTVAGMLVKSDPPKIKPPGPVMPSWHAEPLFNHKQWVQIGMVPMK